jgi:hypothetical protein
VGARRGVRGRRAGVVGALIGAFALGCLATECVAGVWLVTGGGTHAIVRTAHGGLLATDSPGGPDPTEPDTTGPVTTGPVTTEPVPTEPVTTEPVTTAPVTTEPVTQPATTAPGATETVTAPPVIISPAPAAATAYTWLWVLLAVAGGLGLIGLIAWLIARSSRERTDAAAAWRSRRLTTFAEGAALHDATVAAAAPQIPPAEAQARWADVQRRTTDFTQRLYQLREIAPDDPSRASVDQVLASLQALRSATDTARASGTASGMTADIARERLQDFRFSLQALRDDVPRQ